uniref:Uncharacterized protein n=1 Tax=Arundo donax TaxID=35708 RepID=A0A0A9F825_ARUDO
MCCSELSNQHYHQKLKLRRPELLIGFLLRTGLEKPSGS